MLAGTQQSVELKLALDQEQLKSKKLEESMRKLDEEMKRTDELLYQMIPKQVADRLRNGENPIDTCEVRKINLSFTIFNFFFFFNDDQSYFSMFFDLFKKTKSRILLSTFGILFFATDKISLK